MTKDLANQGLADIGTPSRENMNYDANGKLGGCYKGTGIIYHLEEELLGDNKWSIMAWVKASSWGTANNIILCKNVDSTTNCQFYFSIINGTSLHLWINGPEIAAKGFDFTGDVWHHIAATYDGLNYAMYIDGSNVASGTCSNAFSTGRNNLGIGCRSTNASGTTQTGGISDLCLNDVRIYNHALTPKEIKILSEGLVVHYPLSREGFGQDNLLADTDFDGEPKKYVLTHGTEGGFRFEITTLERGAQYTLSCKLRGSANINLYLISSGGNIAFNFIKRDELSDTDYKHFDITFPTRDDRDISQLYICTRYGSNNSSVGDWFEIEPNSLKVEKGDKATPWTPNPADEEYEKLGLDSGVVHDVSGFQNNGTITGSLTVDSDTPKYWVSTYFSGNDYFHLTAPTDEIKTVSLWVKWDVIPSGQSIIFVDYGSKLGLGLMSTGILCGTQGPGNYKTYDKSGLVSDTWYHFVVVNDGADASSTTRKLYINGAEQTPKSNVSNWSFTINELQIGKRSTTNDGFKGWLSDFRAYATPLSQSDILDLYNSGSPGGGL